MSTELTKIVGKGGRCVKWSKVSEVQYIGYFSRKSTRELASITAFEYREGMIQVTGLDGIFNSLKGATDAILLNW